MEGQRGATSTMGTVGSWPGRGGRRWLLGRVMRSQEVAKESLEEEIIEGRRRKWREKEKKRWTWTRRTRATSM